MTIADRRALAAQFRDRLRGLLDGRSGGLARFAREAGVDRSALSQLLDGRSDRLPRAETLRAIAESCNVTTDWLLSLSHAQGSGHEVAPALQFEEALDPGGISPSERWRAEARGYKLRYIPSSIPHLLRLAHIEQPEDIGPPESGMPHPDPAAEARLNDTEAWLADMDVEICMPLQTLETLAQGAGVWRGRPLADRRAQLEHIGAQLAQHYPKLRLHLYDERRITSAPYTVFGPIRAVIYLGPSYLVITAAEQVQAIARHFDTMVRQSVSDHERVQRLVTQTAANAA